MVEDDPFELVDVSVGGGRVPRPATADHSHNRRVGVSPAQSSIAQLRAGLARRPWYCSAVGQTGEQAATGKLQSDRTQPVFVFH